MIGSWPNSYVYSGYIDDRPSPDVSGLLPLEGLPVLRVLAWVPRRLPVSCSWSCLFWQRHHVLPLERPIIAWTDLNHFDSNYTYVSHTIDERTHVANFDSKIGCYANIP